MQTDVLILGSVWAAGAAVLTETHAKDVLAHLHKADRWQPGPIYL